MHRASRTSFVLIASAAVLLVAPGVRAQPDAEASGPMRARRMLETLASSQAARWELRSWERKGRKTEETTARCLWSAEHGMKMEVVGGRGRGARIRVNGDRVRIKPPGVFSFVRMRYSIDDKKLRSLRGHSLRSAPIVERAREVLAWLGNATLTTAARGGLVLEKRNAAGQPESRAMLEDGGGRLALRIEGFDGGELVEFVEYRDIDVRAPVSKSDLEF